MIPKTVLCRCGRPVELRGGRQQARSGNEPWHDFWHVCGVCRPCHFLVQYGHGGRRGDYMHSRWWHTGDKHWESWTGRVRCWPLEWGFVDAGESVQ